MLVSDIKNICVAGGGQMGRQIALNCAIYGYNVFLTSGHAETQDKVRLWAEDYLSGRVAKGKLTEEQAKATAERMH